jgi:kynureninase
VTQDDFSRDNARALDAADPLSELRSRFELPQRTDGSPQAYFAGNSLGALPRKARAALDRVVANWAELAVAGHFAGSEPWYRYDETINAQLAGLVGALEHEVAILGTLTTDLHVLMASFYRPDGNRRKILIEPHAFPSDRYAVASQVALRGGDPATDVITIETADPDAVSVDDVASTLDVHGDQIAMALIGGVNYYTGQFLDLGPIASLLREREIVVGYDLAHAAGNVPVELHDWDVDFAAWCTYKYLNSGPGSTGGIFVHERHGNDLTVPRLAGWWGNDPDLRFDMHAEETFVPMRGAGGWKISNPSVLAMAPVGASIALFHEVGMTALRERSLQLTAFLEQGLASVSNAQVITPTDPQRRGCQLSLRVQVDPGELEHELTTRGVVVDARDPDIIRIAPTPMYNSFEDIVDVVTELRDILGTAPDA